MTDKNTTTTVEKFVEDWVALQASTGEAVEPTSERVKEALRVLSRWLNKQTKRTVNDPEELSNLHWFFSISPALEQAVAEYPTLTDGAKVALLGEVLEEYEALNEVTLEGAALTEWLRQTDELYMM